MRAMIGCITAAVSLWALDGSALAQHGHAREAHVAPRDALRLLKEGNGRTVAGAPKCEVDRGKETRKLLARGQKPHTIVLSCSDSRVPPELVFDQGLGRLFVIRVAGNVLSPPNVASIEYGVEHLGARLIVVMGHESCGAVKATLETPEGKSAGSPSLDALVASIRANLRSTKLSAADREDRLLRAAVRANVDAVVKQLLVDSPLLKKLALSGEVVVVPAIYGLESGAVELWSELGVAKP